MTSKAKVRKPTEEKRSSSEIQWEEVDYAVIEQTLNIGAHDRKYQAITFNLGGVKYTPDYMYILNNDEVLFVEVKGSKFQAGYAYSKARLKMTASQFSMFHFVEALKVKAGWKVEAIEPK